MVRRIKYKVLASIRSKRINVFLLFMALSFIILLLLKLSNTYTKTIAFEVLKEQVPEEKVIVKDSLHQLHITLKTNGFNLLTYYINKPAIKINFKDDVTMVDCLYVWNKSNAFSKVTQQFGKDIELMSITPDTLKFRFDKQAVKSVPVTLNALITFSPGYDLLKPIALTPDSIKIIGPEVLVQAITHIETDSLKLKGLKTEVQKPVTLKLPDNKAGNLKFAANTVTAHITVDKFTEGYLSVPVSIINLPEDVSIKFFPKKVNVSYYTSLASFNQISTKDFRVVCDYNQVLNGAGILTPKVVRQPEQVRHVKVDQKQIEFIIVK